MLDTLLRPAARVERWLQWRFRPVQRSGNSYAGVYPTFAQARAGMGEVPAGYDSEAGASLYAERLDRVFPEDYPVLFWLQPRIAGFSRVFDFGGHVGLHYYGMRSRLDLPLELTWTVSDVPAVMAEGVALARSRQAAALRFEGGFTAGDGADVLLSSGALQYLEADALPEALGRFAQRPRHLVLNKLPVTKGEGFVTVQDVWSFKSPYTVFGRQRLLGALEALGYRLRDEWENPGHHCLVWREPARSVPAYSGFYLER